MANNEITFDTNPDINPDIRDFVFMSISKSTFRDTNVFKMTSL